MNRYHAYVYPTNADLGWLWAANAGEAQRILAREYPQTKTYIRKALPGEHTPPGPDDYVAKVAHLYPLTSLNNW